jgi:hypothetical protein
LTPVFFLVSNWAAGRGQTNHLLWGLLYLCYYLPGLSFVPAITHVQVSVVALAALAVLLTRTTRASEQAVRGLPA